MHLVDAEKTGLRRFYSPRSFTNPCVPLTAPPPPTMRAAEGRGSPGVDNAAVIGKLRRSLSACPTSGTNPCR